MIPIIGKKSGKAQSFSVLEMAIATQIIILKIKSLLSQLRELENSLQSFSLAELSIEDARRLKTSFEAFKTRLEKDFWGEKDPNPENNANRTQGENNQVIATVSHEMRTPLNGIIGFVDLLKETELTEEQGIQVNAIHAASRSLLEIINELLEYSKLSAGQEAQQNVNFNFRAVIDEVSYLCETLILDKDIKFHVEIDSDIPEHLIGDPAKLSQLLLNILGNSIKFVEKGHIVLSILRKSQAEGEVSIEFKVIDTGIGISKKDLKHIFESFKQARHDTPSKYGGTGLGLGIVKQIVAQLGGTMELTSTLGEGTTVAFTIPYGYGSQLPEKPSIEEVPAESVKGLTVLVFEDDQFNKWVLEKRLQSWGCICHITENATYGLQLLQEKKFDLVLMDLHLPGMNGFEITEKIRQHAAAHIHNVPVIAISADIRIADEKKCQESGIDDFILKPYAPEELMLKMISATKLVKEEAYMVRPVNRLTKPESDQPSAMDLEPLLSECLGQTALLEELVLLYKKNILEFIGQMKLHLQNADFSGIKFATHKIKAGLKIIPSPGLLSIVEALHTLAEERNELTVMESLYKAFLNHYPGVEKALDAEIEMIKGRI